MLGGLVLIVGGLIPLALMTELWQFHLFWGIVTGVGTGAVTNVLGATIALRWFRTHRGIVLGAFAAASSAGQLIFIPTLQGIILDSGWRTAVAVLAAAVGLDAAAGAAASCAIDRRTSARRRSGPPATPPRRPPISSEAVRATSLRDAARTRDFWLLAGSFFICGYTSNGLIGTHLIPHAVEHGFTEVTAASAVALMGTMNIVGTLASGWLTDRYDNRRLLAVYYGFRALSIAALPLILNIPQLFLFAIVYGLDWIATVPRPRT